jgi:hypothetical protein
MGAALPSKRGAELVQQVVVGERLFLELDVGVGLAEGLEEVLVILAQEIGVALEHTLIPERQAPLVVERRDLAAIAAVSNSSVPAMERTYSGDHLLRSTGSLPIAEHASAP